MSAKTLQTLDEKVIEIKEPKNALNGVKDFKDPRNFNPDAKPITIPSVRDDFPKIYKYLLKQTVIRSPGLAVNHPSKDKDGIRGMVE